LFVDLLSNNVFLQSSSPAINAGTNSAADEPKTDFDGNARVTGGKIDIGADQYVKKTALLLSSYDLHFQAQDVGTASAPQVVKLTNQKGTAISLDLIATGANFRQANNCGASLAAGSSCQITVTFAPVIGGTISSVVGVFSSATINPLTVDLVGTGLAPQVQFNNPFDFFNQVIGTSSTQTSPLTNTGQAPLTISSIVYNGAMDFVESNNCPNSLAAGASCTISMTYTPTIVGSETGTLTFNDNALPSPQIFYINGSSVSAGVPTLMPATLTFPATLIGQISPTQNATLTNTGTGPLGLGTIYSEGDFSQTNNCPASLAVGASCSISVTYNPSSQGTESGYVLIFTDSLYEATLSLTGTGLAPVPSIASLSINSVPAGSAGTSLIINGSGFVSGSQLVLNGVLLPCCNTYLIGSAQLSVTIPDANVATAGTLQISVFNPTPGGGTSNSLPFTVYMPVNYAVESTKYEYHAITGTNLQLSYYSGAQITSPFAIQFGGGSYTNLTVGSGGTISFNGFTSESNDVIPTMQTPMLVAAFWDTLYPFGTGNDNNVFWAVTGSAPNRELIVEWRDLPYCCGADSEYTVKFEVIFFEGSSNIHFNYANTVFGPTFTSHNDGASATSGVQVASGVGTQYSYDQPLLLSKTSLLWYPSSPTASISTGNLSFGYHQIDSKALAQKVTLTNGSTAPLLISSIAIDNPDFSQTNNCGTSVASHKTCAIEVYFKPSQPLAETATLTITDNSTNSPQTVALTGIGTITPIEIYPIMANFGGVTVGNTGTAPAVLANGSNALLTIQQIAASPAVYTETNNCGSSLPAGASCTVNVTFIPTKKGNVTGSLSMSLDGKPAVAEVKLVGSGQ
jgi:hypothetical protein